MPLDSHLSLFSPSRTLVKDIPLEIRDKVNPSHRVNTGRQNIFSRDSNSSAKNNLNRTTLLKRNSTRGGNKSPRNSDLDCVGVDNSL